MNDTYITKDQHEIAWLTLYNPDLNPYEIVEPKDTGKYTELWFHFPDYERQKQLIDEFQFSREKDFANKLKDIQRFIRNYKPL